MRFVSNFKYTVKDFVSHDLLHESDHSSLAEIGADSEGSFDSHCDQTMVGFVQDMPKDGTHADGDLRNMKTMCFHAKQTQCLAIEKTKPEIILSEWAGEMQKYSKIVYHNKTERESKPAQKVERINHHLGHKPSDKMDLLISWINSAGLGWKADACKLQEHHQDYC